MRNPFRSDRDRLGRRLTAISEELAKIRAQVGVLDEQIVFLQQVASDAQTDAVVAGNSVASREDRAAQSDLARTRRQRDEALQRITHLKAEQDSLLERMLD